MRRRPAIEPLAALLALVCTLALLAAGCGGGSGGGTSTATAEPLPKAEYESLMRTYGRDVGLGLQNVFDARTPEQTQNALTTVPPKLERAASEMATLVPPPEIAKQHAQLVAGIRRFAQDLARAGRQYRNGNVEGLSSLPASTSLRVLQTAYDAITAKGYDLDAS